MLLKIVDIYSNDEKLDIVIEYMENCSWKAGYSLATKIKNHYFKDWERVFIIKDNKNIAGFCTFSAKDGIEHVSYSPYIGYIFVDERYRGKRISLKLIEHCIEYARELEFEYVYIVSDHDGLYEKFDFKVIDIVQDDKGRLEKIYMKEIGGIS